MNINIFSKLTELSNTPLGYFELIAVLVIILCFCAILISIIIDFIKFDSDNRTKQKKRSIVATGTMFLFFICFYLLLKFKIGTIEINSLYIKLIFVSIGLIIIIAGSVINIWGRFNLGKNWANHIKIYQNHTLVKEGVYKLVRHPLYASLIWIFYGACLVYANYYAFLINTFVFIPFMYYRAKQEEELLKKEFSDYNEYRLNVGMFFPKLLKLLK